MNEDFEKKYEEALERARQGLPFDEVFPELKESEDERIMKMILDLVSISGNGNQWEEINAWLLKQKHPSGEDIDYAYAKEQLNEAGYVIMPKSKYEEIMQKPAEKQDYSGLNNLERAILRGFFCAGVENVPVSIIKETAQECIGFLDYPIKQKPAEWKPLPESMEALLLAIEGKWDAIKPTGYMSRRLEDLYDGLVNTFDVDEKYLGNLPKTEYTEKDIEEIKALKEKIDSSMEQKPAEWSEEDENIMHGIEQCVYNNVANIGTVTKIRYIDFLKSLRPQPPWKPSEEQMEAFSQIVRQFKPDKELESLYNDLKKL